MGESLRARAGDSADHHRATATVLTDAGDTIQGKVTYISPQAEFTPRNVQTADERSKLVYRIKVSVDNRAGILKVGMPVDAELSLP